MPRGPEFEKPLTFREIEPIPQWSSRMALDLPYSDFIRTALLTAAKIRHRYTGTLSRDAIGNVTSFTHTRFRRNKYGPPPEIGDCEAGMSRLAAELGSVAAREAYPSGTTRIVLGLYEGQHVTGARTEPDGPDYSVEEVASRLGDGFAVSPAEVFSVRLAPDGSASHYAEELAEVVFPTGEKQRVYLLGDAMKQERFSVEDFAEPQGWSYMVETRWCQEPDPAEPVQT